MPTSRRDGVHATGEAFYVRRPRSAQDCRVSRSRITWRGRPVSEYVKLVRLAAELRDFPVHGVIF